MKKGQDEKSVKGTVRRKIKAFPDMMDLFREGMQAEEDLSCRISFKKEIRDAFF